MSKPQPLPVSSHRRRHSGAAWARWVDEQRASGETIEAFCRSRGLTPSRFYVWRKRLAVDASQNRSGDVGAAVSIAPTLVQVALGVQESALLVAELTNGVRLRVPTSLIGVVLPALMQEAR